MKLYTLSVEENEFSELHHEKKPYIIINYDKDIVYEPGDLLEVTALHAKHDDCIVINEQTVKDNVPASLLFRIKNIDDNLKDAGLMLISIEKVMVVSREELKDFTMFNSLSSIMRR